MLRLGDDSAAALGVHVTRTRVLLIVAAVALLAFATAAADRSRSSRSWPVRSPRASSAPARRLLLPAGLVGALLVLVADLVGQFAFDSRYPVGVITGALGAPYLVFLLIRINRSGGSI